MTPGWRRLCACVEAVSAEGTDPEQLAAVLAWLARPRHGPTRLRRACGQLPAQGRPPGQLLAEVAGRPADEVARVAAELAMVWSHEGVRVALVGDPAYPDRLQEGWPHLDPPVWLAWQGSAPNDAPAVAIVGTRNASGYGTAVAAWLADAVAAAGARVVSGGALGVDAAAHRAALDLPGGTTVVLGCGHAVAYPRPHARPGGLFPQILDEGGTIVGELLPHEPPRAGQVRARNRIVAALADVVVVVEGGGRSGALITAGDAAAWGRTVLAVPGDVRAPGSVAPHRLLAEGAAPCTAPADVLDELGAMPALPGDTGPAGSGQRTPSGGESPGTGDGAGDLGVLPGEALDVLVRRWPRPVRVEELSEESGVPAARLLAVLTRARIAGLVAEGPDGIRLRRAPGAGSRR